MSSLRLCALVGLSAAAAVPATMNAFVAESASSFKAESEFRTPQVGDLHKVFGDLPHPCEVVVKVAASSINPCDAGTDGERTPKVLGSDIAGTVVEVGDQCTLKVGDEVWGDIGANGHLKNVFKSKTKVLGGYAEYAVAVESQLSLKPKNLGMIEAGALPKVALTSYKALQWYANAGNWTKAAAGPVVLVLGGSGGTGTCGIQLAKAYGASKVITTTSADNFAYVKALGADQVLDFRTQDWWTVLAAHSVDIVYDTVGQSGTGSRAMEVLNCQSQYFGHYVSITGALAPSPAKGCTQAAFINSDTNLDDGSILASLAALAEADKLRMPSIDSVFGIADVEKGFARSKTHEAKGKISIVCNHTAAQ